MKQIKIQPSVFHPLSYCDSSMRLFDYDGELLRGIDESRAPHIASLLDDGLLHDLVARKLFVPTEVTDYACSEYPLVLRHERLPRVTYPNEWPPAALKAAGRMILDLQDALLQYSYLATDVYPWNVVFRGSRPIFVDLGSIGRRPNRSALLQFIDEFHRFYLWPLELAENGLWRYVTYFFGDYEKGVQEADVRLLLRRHIAASKGKVPLTSRVRSTLKHFTPAIARQALRRVRPRKNSGGGNRTGPRVESARRHVADLRDQLLRITPANENAWTRYYDEFSQHGSSFDDASDWNLKQRHVKQILSEIRPKSLFDVCSNSGWYSVLAESLGSEVIAADVVPDVMDQLYLRAQKEERNIYPIVMDFRYPTPARGVANRWFRAATERLRAELVLCLAALHHLVCHCWLSFDQIVEGLYSFTDRWLLIEFVPAEDETAREYGAARYRWYTEAEFVKALNHRFRVIQRLPSYEKPRQLFLCERKDYS